MDIKNYFYDEDKFVQHETNIPRDEWHPLLKFNFDTLDEF